MTGEVSGSSPLNGLLLVKCVLDRYMFEEPADIFIRKTDSSTKQDQTVRPPKDQKLPWRVG